jgi:myo-inositol 2-dehydrogenase/D-chiro-inositol 1-dehydrogenase
LEWIFNRGEMNMSSDFSRRDFMKASVAAGAGTLMSGGSGVFASGSDRLRIGLIGCGFRGTGAAIQALTCSNAPVKLWAMGDMFPERIAYSYSQLSSGGNPQYDRQAYPPLIDKLDVPKERQFVGFDAYQKVIDSGVDMVILTTPPHFRPLHLKAAVEAGKHAFIEKPVAVDPVGVRSVIASAALAKKKSLSIVAGTQRRYTPSYVEVIKRIHNGEIGKILSAQCYWNTGFVRNDWYWHERKAEWSDMEWQLRNWYYFTWLCGDHIVEQHVHNLDVINWAMGAHPVKAMGMGGRQVRTEPQYGNIFDHFAVEFEYPNGARVTSMCRQIDGCSVRVGENIVGDKGSARDGIIEGLKPFKYDGPNPDPYVEEHVKLQESIRQGKPVNDGQEVAESTLTAIMGRMSAYTGRALSWNWVLKASKLDLSPPEYVLGDLPVRPVAVPGQTELV